MIPCSFYFQLLDNDDDDDACTISVSSEDEETSKVKPVNIIEKESNSCSHDTQVKLNSKEQTFSLSNYLNCFLI